VNKNIYGLIFNTRSETIQSKSSFRPAFFSRRALIPADGFFEWGYVMDPSLIDEISEEVMFDFGYKAPKKRSKSRGRAKKAFLISRNDGMTFALAAIFDITYIPDDTSGNRTELSLKNYAEPRPERGGQFLYSCSIITTEANADIAHIHHRQPVIIEKGDWQDWLSPNSSPQELAKLLECSPIGTLGSDPFPTGS
jgi:putative SOS response-associated peptidase YedK